MWRPDSRISGAGSVDLSPPHICARIFGTDRFHIFYVADASAASAHFFLICLFIYLFVSCFFLARSTASSVVAIRLVYAHADYLGTALVQPSLMSNR